MTMMAGAHSILSTPAPFHTDMYVWCTGSTSYCRYYSSLEDYERSTWYTNDYCVGDDYNWSSVSGLAGGIIAAIVISIWPLWFFG